MRRSGSGSVMHRSFAEHLGVSWPPEVAMVIGGKPVTWTELLDQRRERQAMILRMKREVQPPRFQPAYVWTFFISGDVYYGWHCYVVTRQESIGVTFRGFKDCLAESIMRALPLGILPQTENFDEWMIALAKKRPRAKHPRDRRKAGSLIGWYDTHKGVFSLTKPSDSSLPGDPSSVC